MYNNWVTLFLTIVFVSIVNTVESSGRIVGGQVIKINKAPYVVRLKLANGRHVCGGTLVTSQHVVTAAHCLDFLDPIKSLLVVAGVSGLKEKGVERRIVKYAKPAAYSRDTAYMDCAVLKMNAPIPESPTTKPIPLCSRNLKASDLVQISGFGRAVGGGKSSQKLRTIFVPIISNSECSQTHTLTDTMICTAAPDKGTCQGDSGGPLVHKGELCGIVVGGVEGCDYSTSSPAIFTNVNAVTSYLKQAIMTL